MKPVVTVGNSAAFHISNVVVMPLERYIEPADAKAEVDPVRNEAEGDLNHALGPSNVIIVTELSEDVLMNPADLELLKTAFADADAVEDMRPFPSLGRVCSCAHLMMFFLAALLA